MTIRVQARAGRVFAAAQFWPGIGEIPAGVLYAASGVAACGGRIVNQGDWIVSVGSRQFVIDSAIFDVLFEPVGEDEPA